MTEEDIRLYTRMLGQVELAGRGKDVFVELRADHTLRVVVDGVEHEVPGSLEDQSRWIDYFSGQL